VKNKYFCSTFVFISCCLFSASGFAAGKIVIQPKIHSGFQNDSNYFSAEDREVSVNTYYTKPGIVFGYETPKTSIALDATVNAYWYESRDTTPPGVRDASDDDFVGFTGILSADHQLTNRLNIGISDQLYKTRDPARSDVVSNSVDRDKYTINYLEPKVYYELADKFGILTKYRNTVTDYEENLEDSNENRGIFDLFYHLNSRSAVYLDYQVWQRDFDQDSSDYTSNVVSLNYERTFNYFTIEGGAGYHHRSFDEEAIDDIDFLSWEILIKGQDPDSTLKTTRSRMMLNVGQTINDDGTGDEYFIASFAKIEGGYRLFRSLEVSVEGWYLNSDYETSVRDDDTYRASARLAYQALEFLTLGVEGGFETRDSNLDGFSYDNTFVLLTLDIDYDFGSR
jgi:hypothetical protein